MARRTRNLPVASADGAFPVAEIDWPQIEVAYGCSLSVEIRNEIREVTTEFAAFAPFENTVKPLKPARDLVQSWRRAAGVLQRKIFEGQVEHQRYAKHLVRTRFGDERLPNKHLFENLAGILTSLIVACDSSLNHMDGAKLPEIREGECWQKWIKGLIRLLNKAGL